MDKRAKDKLVRSPRENGGGQDTHKDLHSRTGRDEKKGKPQGKMERGSRKRSSSVLCEKMERVGGSWLGHLERIEEDRIPKKIFTQEPEGTRRRGKPRERWKEEVERDLQVLCVRRWRESVEAG